MTQGGPEAQDWARQRREVAQAHAERLARTRQLESVRARELILGFVREAGRRRLAASPLLAKAGDGRPTYRTGLVGWYLTRDGSIGVTTDAQYYLLTSPRSLRARAFGVTLQPAEPPLQVGAGARDGESIALDALLALRLDAGDDWALAGR